ncbi:glycoside hydrolase family 76 protein [Aspergillus undulatus]|uniref:glycoside hydrolase family 76 protein n=1 Tax=Aspergillus undulatus TaxID=1810928 RepID=UPI003CCD2FB2
MRWGSRSLLSLGGAALVLLLQGQVVLSDIPITATDKESLKEAGKTIIEPMWDFYLQNQTEGIPGKLTGTWYIAGAMFMTMMQFWHVSGYNEHNSVVSHDMMFQAGRNYDYFDANYSQWLGNDDQMFFGLAAITASETGFPEINNKPTWTSLARSVFNQQVDRWNDEQCDGGITWQIHPWQAGYTLRNSISNGGLFQLAARLGRFTQNQTYFEWAERIWDWSVESPLIQPEINWYVADSTSGDNNCQDSGDMQWSYNYGVYLAGTAYMYNATEDPKWKNRTQGLLGRLSTHFFPQNYDNHELGGKIFCEVSCEKLHTCDRNMLNFKGWSSMWMAMAGILVPETYDTVLPKLQGSAAAIGRQCDGGSNGENLCGSRWYQDTWDGIQGLEVQQAALGGITGTLMMLVGNGAQTIENNPDAKERYLDYNDDQPDSLPKITTGDRVGSWILTVLWGSGIVAAGWWLIKQQ